MYIEEIIKGKYIRNGEFGNRCVPNSIPPLENVDLILQTLNISGIFLDEFQFAKEFHFISYNTVFQYYQIASIGLLPL